MPLGTTLLHSPGCKPWVNHWNTFIEPHRGGTSVRVLGVVVGLCLLCCIYPLGHLRAWDSAAPTELDITFRSCVPRVLFVPLALSPPWAMRECRPFRAHCTLLYCLWYWGEICGNWGIDWCGRAISPFRGDTPA